MLDAQATSADAWPGRPDLHTLPSGAKARLKRVSVLAMLRNGTVPNPLLKVAIRVSEAPVDLPEPELDGDDQASAAAQPITPADSLRFMGVLIAAAFVEPRVTIDVDENGLPVRTPGLVHLDDVSDADQKYALSIALGASAAEMAAAEPFRDEPAGDHGGGDGGGVRDASEPAARAV